MSGKFFGSKKKCKLWIDGEEVIDGFIPGSVHNYLLFRSLLNSNMNDWGVKSTTTQPNCTSLYIHKTHKENKEIKEIKLPLDCSYKTFKATFPKIWDEAVCKAVENTIYFSTAHIKNIHIDNGYFLGGEAKIKIRIFLVMELTKIGFSQDIGKTIELVVAFSK